MQSEPEPYRYRGYRASRPLVQHPRRLAADLKGVVDQQDLNGGAHAALEASLATLCETRVSQLQHYRAQLRFRLLKRD